MWANGTSIHTGNDATDCYAYGGMEGLLYGLPLAGKRLFSPQRGTWITQDDI